MSDRIRDNVLNSKLEARNPKQIQMKKVLNSKQIKAFLAK